MPIRFLGTALALLLAANPALAGDNPILERIKIFTAAYNAKNAKAISGFYLEKGVLLPPRSEALVGRVPIANHYANAFKGGATNLRYKVLEIEQAGPATVIEIAETSVDVNDRTIKGRALHIWKKNADEWFLARDMYHVLRVDK